MSPPNRTPTADRPVDVCIVGAGPVGLVLGILLAQHGRSVTILEQHTEPYRLPRAVHFDHEVGRILQSCGIGDDVRAVSEPAEVYEWRNAAGTTLLRFGRIGAAASGWPFSSMFCQPDLEAIIERRADALASLDVRRGVRVVGIEQHDDGVDVHADAGSVPARYLVGCDGANSTVRDLVDIDVDDIGFSHDWLIVDVVLREERVFDPINVQLCDPARPTTAVSGGPGRRRWEFMRLPDETIEDMHDETLAWELLAPWDVVPGNATLERHAVYTFGARTAAHWKQHRVFLAGDAAHQMPPFAGQGMCAGLRDAANLAWKLDLVLDGRADPSLLDTYDLERRPNAAAAIEFSVELGKVICVSDPVEAAARDEAMAAGVDGVSDAPALPGIADGLIADESPGAGALFPQAALHDGWFDDVHGAGWRFVTIDASPSEMPDRPVPDRPAPDPVALDAAVVDWFRSIGGAVVAVPDDGEIAAWFADHGARWALQRPDFHLYGTAPDADAATHLLGDLRRRLTTETT